MSTGASFEQFEKELNRLADSYGLAEEEIKLVEGNA